MMLKACPFCGGTPKAYFFADTVIIECLNKNCEARVQAVGNTDGHPSAEQAAMRKWNRRA